MAMVSGLGTDRWTEGQGRKEIMICQGRVHLICTPISSQRTLRRHMSKVCPMVLKAALQSVQSCLSVLWRRSRLLCSLLAPVFKTTTCPLLSGQGPSLRCSSSLTCFCLQSIGLIALVHFTGLPCVLLTPQALDFCCHLCRQASIDCLRHSQDCSPSPARYPVLLLHNSNPNWKQCCVYHCPRTSPVLPTAVSSGSSSGHKHSHISIKSDGTS